MEYCILYLIILLGFRYSASSIPSTSLVGVAIGVGSVLASPVLPISRNPSISNNPIRRASTGFSSVEFSGSIGLVYSFLISYASLSKASFIIFPCSALLLL